jgi:hypothetical protein
MRARLKTHVSYANVMATIAVFIALGGTSYAATKLARNSVGSTQIRSKSVGSSELKNRAVTSSKIRSRSITASKLSSSARTTLRGATGPAGPQGAAGPAGPSGATYRAAVNSGAGVRAGTGTAEGIDGSYLVGFDRSMAGCVFTATLARVEGGSRVDPDPGRITVAEEAGKIRVRTYNADGAPLAEPFNVLAAC